MVPAYFLFQPFLRRRPQTPESDSGRWWQSENDLLIEPIAFEDHQDSPVNQSKKEGY
jgi:hypothetical protein